MHRVAAVWQPLDEHLEVFALNARGAINDAWKAHDAAWQQTSTISGPSLSLPGTPVSAAWQPLDEHLEVFAIDSHDVIQDVCKAHDGAGQYDLAGLFC